MRSILNGIIVAIFNRKRNEVSSFPSFPPPINPVRYPPLTGFFYGKRTAMPHFWQRLSMQWRKIDVTNNRVYEKQGIDL